MLPIPDMAKLHYPFVEESIKQCRGHPYDPLSPFNYVPDFGPHVFRFMDQSGLLPLATMKPSLCSKAGSLHPLIHLDGSTRFQFRSASRLPGNFLSPFCSNILQPSVMFYPFAFELSTTLHNILPPSRRFSAASLLGNH
jgi:hypothetical protein